MKKRYKKMNTPKVPYDIRELSRSQAVKFKELLNDSFEGCIEPGQVWSTHSSYQLPNGQKFQTDEPRLVVILLGTNNQSKEAETITVAPLSIHTSMASEYDFIVKQESGNSPLTFDFMVEI
jgi:hypothetical protein